jgi:hypothetical protein
MALPRFIEIDGRRYLLARPGGGPVIFVQGEQRRLHSGRYPCWPGARSRVGAHHLSRKLQSLGHDAQLMPAKYVRPYAKGQKNEHDVVP